MATAAKPAVKLEVPRLLEQYRKTIAPELAKKFGYKNAMQSPKLDKIVLNMGVGAASQDIKLVEKAAEEMALIAGQKPVITRAKKAISNFKLRQGQPIGVKVTLRRYRMYEFFDRLVSVAMPRIRDFRGVDARKGFDEGGNFSFGLNEQLIFPEIEYDKVSRTQGMDVTICTTAKSRDEAMQLLKSLGMPFKEQV